MRLLGALAVAFSLTSVSFTGAPAHADFQVPSLTGPVVDQAHMLSATAADQLSTFLRTLYARTGTQIQVATVPDLQGLPIEDVSIQITDKWKIGKSKDDRGLLLLIANKEHKIRIEVGRGLEGDLPDVIGSRIIRDVMVPRLHQGQPDQAVMAGVLAIVHYTNPKFLKSYPAGGSAAYAANGHSHFPWGLMLSIAFFLFAFFFQGGLFLPFFFGGGFGGGGFGGGGFGGGGGGGWSGGGGGFGGGGASGGW